MENCNEVVMRTVLNNDFTNSLAACSEVLSGYVAIAQSLKHTHFRPWWCRMKYLFELYEHILYTKHISVIYKLRTTETIFSRRL